MNCAQCKKKLTKGEGFEIEVGGKMTPFCKAGCVDDFKEQFAVAADWAEVLDRDPKLHRPQPRAS